MCEQLLFSIVVLVISGLATAQDRASQQTSHNVSLSIAAEAQVRVERAYALYRDHQVDVALREAREAHRLDPNNTAASGLITLLSLALGSRSGHSMEPLGEEVGRAEHVDPGDIVLRTDRPILLRLLQAVTSGPSNEDALAAQVVHDVTVNGTVVIQKQTPVKYSVERQAAGDSTEPGVLTLSFDSVASISGDEIPLASSESAVGKGGKPTCFAESCILLPLADAYAHARKGHEAALPQGLLTAAYVKRDYILRAAKMPQAPAVIVLPTHTASSRSARVHFYYNDTIGLHEGLPVRVDNTKIGILPSWHYACTTVKSGVHDVKIGKTSLRQLLFDAGGEYFVKAETNSKGFTVDRTEDYSIDARPLLPTSFKKDYSVDCWD